MREQFSKWRNRWRKNPVTEGETHSLDISETENNLVDGRTSLEADDVAPKLFRPGTDIAAPSIGFAESKVVARALRGDFGDLSNSTSTRGETDHFMTQLLHEYGFDGMPSIESNESINRACAAGDYEVFRGDTRVERVRALWAPEFDIRGGIEGPGLYVYHGPNARTSAEGHVNPQDMRYIIRMTLKIGALVRDNLNFDTSAHADDADSLARLNLAYYAASLGLDAVFSRRPGVLLVLNRTALRIEYLQLEER